MPLCFSITFGNGDPLTIFHRYNIYITSEEETSETRQTSQAMLHALLHRHCGLSHALCNSFFSEKGVTVTMTDGRTQIRTTVNNRQQ